MSQRGMGPRKSKLLSVTPSFTKVKPKTSSSGIWEVTLTVQAPKNLTGEEIAEKFNYVEDSGLDGIEILNTCIKESK